MSEQGFSVNDFEHLEDAAEPGLQQRRDANGWGFVREDLAKYHVHMVTDVHFVWSEETPEEMRKVFGEASVVVHHIAEKAVMAQLEFDGLKPVETRELLVGDRDGEHVILRDSGWRPE